MPKRYPKVTRVAKDPEDYEAVVQIDVDNPAEERVTASGHSRLPLNKREKTLIKERQMVASAIALIIEKGLSFSDAAEQSGLGKDGMRAAITGEVYPEMKELAMKKAIDRYIDLGEGTVSGAAIAEELGLNLRQYNDMIRSPLFKDMYNEHFAALQSHPAIQAVQSGLVDKLLPKAYNTLDDILTNKKTSATVRLNAAKEVIRLAGIQPVSASVSERGALAEFLNKHNLSIENFNVNLVPPQYQEGLSKYDVSVLPDEPPELVDGIVTEDTDAEPGG